LRVVPKKADGFAPEPERFLERTDQPARHLEHRDPRPDHDSSSSRSPSISMPTPLALMMPRIASGVNGQH
jgi:hypothetical protein